jgi:hypothetical protein
MYMHIPPIRIGASLALLFSFALCCSAQEGPKASEQPLNTQTLIKEVVYNELHQPEGTEFHSWKQRQIKPARTTVKQYVETPEGLLGRVLTMNGKPLTGNDLAKEDARINRLLDPRQMQQKRKQQKEDENRSRRIVAALPDAFIYKITGTEEKDGHTLVKLHFTPNPGFSAPNHETLVLQGMEGDMVIDRTDTRLVKIDGTMTRDVSIGWGILGRLDKGGHFVVEQHPVDKGDWEVTYMRLDFTGKALIFKTIRIDETDTSYDFKKIPKMSVAEAISFLKKADSDNGAVAEK